MIPGGCIARSSRCPVDRPIEIHKTAGGFARSVDDNGYVSYDMDLPQERPSWCCDESVKLADVMQYTPLPSDAFNDRFNVSGPVRFGTTVDVTISTLNARPYVFDPQTGRTTYAPREQ